MGRKNSNAAKGARPRKYNIPKNTHFMYSPHEDGSDATVVRYLGEQNGDTLLVWHPEGYSMFVHLHHLWRSRSMRAVA